MWEAIDKSTTMFTYVVLGCFLFCLLFNEYYIEMTVIIFRLQRFR